MFEQAPDYQQNKQFQALVAQQQPSWGQSQSNNQQCDTPPAQDCSQQNLDQLNQNILLVVQAINGLGNAFEAIFEPTST